MRYLCIIVFRKYYKKYIWKNKIILKANNYYNDEKPKKNKQVFHWLTDWLTDWPHYKIVKNGYYY